MIELIIEGKGLAPALREMERSPYIEVLGPHISNRRSEARVTGIRIAVHSAAEASSVVRHYLPEGARVKPCLKDS